jgi:hypothetical protein
VGTTRGETKWATLLQTTAYLSGKFVVFPSGHTVRVQWPLFTAPRNRLDDVTIGTRRFSGIDVSSRISYASLFYDKFSLMLPVDFWNSRSELGTAKFPFCP